MPRDLMAEQAAANGHSAAAEDAAFIMDEPATERVAAPSRELREARQDQSLAAMAGLMVRAAGLLEPVVAMLSRRLLGWAALGASVGLAVYAIRQPTPERVAVVAVFMVLAPWLIRRVA